MREPQSPLAELEQARVWLMDSIRGVTPTEFKRQYHPDLSPLGWHLGHCVFTETYWIREVILRDNHREQDLKSLFVPELCPKEERGGRLPDYHALLDWAEQTQQRNHALLGELLSHGNTHPLLDRAFLPRFLAQHYAQHYETTCYIHAVRQLQQEHMPPESFEPLSAREPAWHFNRIAAGEYQLGGDGGQHLYDNEYPAFTVYLDAFQIAQRPVSNAEFLAFMLDGGYTDAHYWTTAGWCWRQENNITRPQQWLTPADQLYYGVNEHGPHALPPEQPVSGLSYHEATAFANWTGARLPHEYEWEAAKKAGLLIGDGQVWEWCANCFHPYAGFSAFPYTGYSVPYFDGRHYTLRGGSRHTRDLIRRPSFRNYYQAGKRHIHAGLRLVLNR